MVRPSRTQNHEILGKIRTYVISLRDEPRNSSLIEQLQSQGFAPRIITAVDGRSGIETLDANLFDLRALEGFIGRPPTGPEIACALSHAKVARLAKEEGAPYALIFEDDALVVSNLLPLAKCFAKVSAGSASVLSLYSPEPPIFAKSSEKGNSSTDAIFELGRLLVPPPTTVGYLLNKKAIELFAKNRVIQSTADWPPWSFSADFWGSNPWAVCPLDSSLSDIQSQRGMTKPAHEQSLGFRSMIARAPHFFSLRRIFIHSRALGGLRPYLRRVIFPYARVHLRFIVLRSISFFHRSR